MKNVVLDIQGGYGFSLYPLTELPPGAYYPELFERSTMLLLKPFATGTMPGNGAAPDATYQSEERHFPMERYHRTLRLAREDVDWFLASREFYLERGMPYKRGLLFYGPPGTGKSRFVAEVERQLIQYRDAVSIHIETDFHLDCITDHLIQLAGVLEGRFKLFIIEELADLSEHPDARTRILNLLESTMLRNDLLFLVTTNRAEDIPRNLVDRPSRLDLLLEVAPADLEEGFIEAWHEFVMGVPFPSEQRPRAWVAEAREHLTPVYWTELFRMAQIRGLTLEQAWKEIKRRRDIIERNFQGESAPIGFATPNGFRRS